MIIILEVEFRAHLFEVDIEVVQRFPIHKIGMRKEIELWFNLSSLMYCCLVV